MSAARLAGVSAALAAVLGVGMIYATGQMPHRLVDFEVSCGGWRGPAGVAVVPKVAGRIPVVVYLHGSGDSLERSTGTLRQFAELGLAAVCMDYTQTNAAAFAPQFEGLLAWVAAQPWADTNRVAWVGFSLGAQRMLSHVCDHPEAAPPFFVRLAGGRVPELEREPLRLRGKAWLVHGEHDETFRASEAEAVRQKLLAAGMSVELSVLPGQGHAFGEHRHVVLRRLAERCAEELNPNSEVARRAAGGSAGLQPAVSRVFNPQTSRTFLNGADGRMPCRLQVGGNSRLQVCATPLGSPTSEFGLKAPRPGGDVP